MGDGETRLTGEQRTRQQRLNWDDQLDRIYARYGFIADEHLLQLPYTRFVQMIRTVDRNHRRDRKLAWQMVSWPAWWCSSRELKEAFDDFLRRSGFEITDEFRTRQELIEEAREELGWMTDPNFGLSVDSYTDEEPEEADFD